MKLPRRRFLHLAAGAATLSAMSRMASAQTYPSRPVRIVVGFAAGGATDISARLIGQAMSIRLARTFIVENRPGASSNIAAEAVVRAPADGYTLLMATNVNAINATLYEKLTFNFARDLAPVVHMGDGPLVMVVSPQFPAKTVPEFLTYARAKKINAGSPGAGTPGHVAGEMLRIATGANLVQVQYRGEAPALADLLGAQVDVVFPTVLGCVEYIRDGKLRALAVTSESPSPTLPDIPVMADFIPGFEANYWTGLVAPKGTSAEIINKLNTEVNAALADNIMKERFADLGLTVSSGSPADFGKLIADETEKWGKAVKAAGIKLD
jgi:tripartite-type tricarboxylate transporter receptor subunit TctC